MTEMPRNYTCPRCKADNTTRVYDLEGGKTFYIKWEEKRWLDDEGNVQHLSGPSPTAGSILCMTRWCRDCNLVFQVVTRY